MNNLYEYIDPIASPYEVFLFDSNTSPLPIPAHWHYYAELLYIHQGTITVSMDNTLVTGTRGCVILFPPRCMHSIALEKDIFSSQYDVIKFDPDLLPSCKMDVLDLRAVLHSVHVLHCPCLFSPEQVQEMNLEPLFSEILLEYQRRDFVSSMILTTDLRKIVSKLVRFWQKDKNYFSVSGVHPSYEVSFDRICEYIDTHYFDELTVKSLAAMCGLSHSTFSLNFYRRYQMTCKE